MTHNPNPFDFVSFGKEVIVRSLAEWSAVGETTYSGYLEVDLKTLTPLHISGRQDAASGMDGKKIGKSFFYRQGENLPCIPGSSIKGMLRSFIEALTGGWVSQVTPTYEKLEGKRHIGFSVFDEYSDYRNRKSPQAVPSKFRPVGLPERADLATFMFGFVEEATNGSTSKALKGRIGVEDAFIAPDQLETRKLPDIEGDAFMGGPHPCASSWWYMSPREIWNRRAAQHQVAEFVGRSFRGRKFYFHQDPGECLLWYDKNWKKENQVQKKDKTIVEPPYYTYDVEALKTNAIASFRISIKELPEPLLALFCLCLNPGQTIRHKLGYGKAYGFGSVEFSISSAKLRRDYSGEWPAPLTNHKDKLQSIIQNAWDEGNLKMLGIDAFVDRTSLNKLAQILGWSDNDDITFTYPPFNRQNFARPITFVEACEAAKICGLAATGDKIVVQIKDETKPVNKGGEVAEGLFDKKRTIALLAYQLKSNGWDTIKKRKP